MIYWLLRSMIQFHFIIISKDADSLACGRLAQSHSLSHSVTHSRTLAHTHKLIETQRQAQRVKAKTGSICAICLQNSNLSLQIDRQADKQATYKKEKRQKQRQQQRQLTSKSKRVEIAACLPNRQVPLGRFF